MFTTNTRSTNCKEQGSRDKTSGNSEPVKSDSKKTNENIENQGEKNMLTIKDKNKVLAYVNTLQKESIDNFGKPIGLEAFVMPYSHGIILQIKYNNPAGIVIHFGDVKKNIGDAFDELTLNIDNYLDDKLQEEFHHSEPDEKDLFFAGTNLLYTSDKLYIIKENSHQYWTQSAAKKDARRIKNDVDTFSKSSRAQA